MNSAPKVSVLMTAYNRSKYIGQAIETVLHSTYTNLELIIVDDGSKDNTVSIAKEYASRDNRVQVHVNEKNLGDYPNRNQAASYATGKYLKYVDADDLIYPWGLEVMVNCMEKFPQAAYGLCSLEQHNTHLFPLQLSPAEAYAYEYKGPGLFHKAPLSAIINREIFNRENGFKPLRMCGDFEMWHRLSVSYPVVVMPNGMVWYRKHEGQEMNHYQQFATQYEDVRLNYLTAANCPLDNSGRQNILDNHKSIIKKEILKNQLRFRFAEAESWRNLYKRYKF
jgi:glycosyltransferase involved in cell wall biosynthesis